MTVPKLTAAQRAEMAQDKVKDRAKVKFIVGRKIVKAEPNGSWEGENSNGVWMHDWTLTLDDGSQLVFLTEEHPDAGKYGIDLIRREPPTRAAETERSHPSAPASYMLHGVDGDSVLLTLPDFLAHNQELGSAVVDTIRLLAPGETYKGGGGAAPLWSITRMENS